MIYSLSYSSRMALRRRWDLTRARYSHRVRLRREREATRLAEEGSSWWDQKGFEYQTEHSDFVTQAVGEVSKKGLTKTHGV